MNIYGHSVIPLLLLVAFGIAGLVYVWLVSLCRLIRKLSRR